MFVLVKWEITVYSQFHSLQSFAHSPTSLVCMCAGKAPPNLSQGVPPLLPNQYIMGPGGLLPAYPVRTFILLIQIRFQPSESCVCGISGFLCASVCFGLGELGVAFMHSCIIVACHCVCNNLRLSESLFDVFTIL